MTSPEVWFTSDLHFGHANIIKYCNRPFDSVDEMNEALITYWNETVAPTDHVWVLGDVFMGKKAETMPLAKRLHGEKFLIPGNHDGCHPMFSSEHKESKQNRYLKACREFYEVGFIVCKPQYDSMTFRPGAPDVNVCHFPYEGDSHDEDRYEQWRPQDRGLWQLCGHVHDAWKVNGRSINVGTDVWNYRPVNREVLLGMMS